MINQKKLIYLRAKGYSNKEIAEILNCNRITIQRNLLKFKKMSDKEFKEYI
jgi:DNA-binding CsgD family transcriptional regulator